MSCKQIFESYQENIQSVSNWFEQKFNSQSISQTASQVSNGSLMLTPNVTVKQATKSEECLTGGKAQQMDGDCVLIMH